MWPAVRVLLRADDMDVRVCQRGIHGGAAATVTAGVSMSTTGADNRTTDATRLPPLPPLPPHCYHSYHSLDPGVARSDTRPTGAGRFGPSARRRPWGQPHSLSRRPSRWAISRRRRAPAQARSFGSRNQRCGTSSTSFGCLSPGLGGHRRAATTPPPPCVPQPQAARHAPALGATNPGKECLRRGRDAPRVEGSNMSSRVGRWTLTPRVSPCESCADRSSSAG